MYRYLAILTHRSYGPISDRKVLVESSEHDEDEVMAIMQGSFYMQRVHTDFYVSELFRIDDLFEWTNEEDPVIEMKFVTL